MKAFLLFVFIKNIPNDINNTNNKYTLNSDGTIEEKEFDNLEIYISNIKEIIEEANNE